MNAKGIGVCVCLMVLTTFSLVGCSSTSTNTEVKPPTQSTPQAVTPSPTATPKAEELKEDLIKIKDELTFNYKDGIGTEVVGTVTNNNKLECNIDFEVFFFNPDGTLLTSEVFQVTDIKAGETKLFSNKVMDKDLRKTSHKIQFEEFFTYTK
jgi:uncharacterized protein YcfL